MTDVFEQYISGPGKVTWMNIKRYRAQLTRRQALRDLAQLRYVFANRYSGKDYWERQGISFEQCYAQIEAFVRERESIYVGDFCRAIHKAFDVGIVDNHLAIASPSTGRLCFGKKYAAWFTDILAEKIDGAYKVIAGERVELTDPACLFPTLSPPGRKFYLVGCRSWDEISSMRIGDKTVPVHRCRAGLPPRGEDVCLCTSNENGVDIVRSNCCDYTPALTERTDIQAIGSRFAHTDRLVWDNLGNVGGYSRIPRDFILGLNGYACAEEYSAKLVSPLSEGRPCGRKWQMKDAARCEPERGSYGGTLYFLMNSGTGSSGETSVLYAKSLRGAVFVGENTLGCNTFGNTASYQLKRSGIVLTVPNRVNLCRAPDDCAEGRGFTPDYWVDREDVRGELLRWLGNPEEYWPMNL